MLYSSIYCCYINPYIFSNFIFKFKAGITCFKNTIREFSGIQWLGLSSFTARAQVQSLVGESRSHKLQWFSSEESPDIAGGLGSIPGSGRSLEKEMADRSNILAWEIPWTEEPGEL